jgi:hypothetical protein
MRLPIRAGEIAMSTEYMLEPKRAAGAWRVSLGKAYTYAKRMQDRIKQAVAADPQGGAKLAQWIMRLAFKACTAKRAIRNKITRRQVEA